MKTTSTRDRAASETAAPAHFLPHIQGLRAIAVLLVVIYHFWPGRLSGGYIGVDVFFVISGFLITQQLTRELQSSGSIRLPAFWAKRVRRLLPASVLVLVFSAAMTLLLMPLSALAENVREILASTFYVENWALAANSVDYLAASNDASLVQHYWSLSLEEQFYLVWPLLLLAASAIGIRVLKRRRAALIGMVAGISIVSFVICVVYTQTDAASAYFVTYTRVWEFGAGALLALLPAMRPARGWVANVLGYAGVVVVLGAGYFYDASTPFPGTAALLPVLGTAAIIAAPRPVGAGQSRWFDTGRVLSMRGPRFIGDISYSLYLWHWPLIVVAPFIPGWGLSIYNRIALLALCFVLAWLTKKFVEDPTRTWSFWTARKARTTYAFMLAGMAVVSLVIGSVSFVQQPKYDQAAAQLAETVADPPQCFGAASGAGPTVTDPLGVHPPAATLGSSQQPDCPNPALASAIIPSPGFGNADNPGNTQCLVTLNDSTLSSCHFGSTDATAPRVALIGDSHAYALLTPFIRMATEQGWSLTTYIKGGCAWNTDPLPGGDAFTESCARWRASLSAELANVQPYSVVFTAALADAEAPGTTEAGAALATGFSEAWKQATGRGTPVVTMVDNPAWSDDPNKCLRTQPAGECGEPTAEGLVADPPVALAAAASIADGQPVTLLDFSDTFCVDGTCQAVIGGANVYRDSDHLTNTFATTLQPYLLRALQTALTAASAQASAEASGALTGSK